MGKIVALLFLFIVFSTPLSAQILNFEKSRLAEDSLKRIIGNIGVSFSLNNRSANPDQKIVFVGLNGNSNLGYFTTNHAFLLIGAINYTSITGSVPISTGFGHFRINFLRKRKLSYETFAQIQYDESRGLRYRSLGGAGIRLSLIETKSTDVDLGIGAMWETEEWKLPEEDGNIEVKNIPKSSNYISLKTKITEYINFNMINYYQVGYDGEDEVVRHRFSIDASLIFTINKYLSFTNNFNGGYENKPVIPIQKFVYSVSNGILIKF